MGAPASVVWERALEGSGVKAVSGPFYLTWPLRGQVSINFRRRAGQSGSVQIS